MENINYDKMLDLTMKELQSKTSFSYIPYPNIFSSNDIFSILSNRDKFAIVEKLITDGYVKKYKTDIDNYYITIEGILFLKSKGYSGKRISEKRLKFWHCAKNVLLVIGTVSAAILATIEIVEKSTSVPNPFCISNQNKFHQKSNISLQHNKETQVHTCIIKNIKPIEAHNPMPKK